MGTQKTVLVTEDAAGSNTIKGVKIIGTESLNGRRYPIEVLEKCYKLYEGALVNINHKLGAEGRDYTDRIGRVVNVRCESDGLYGDLVYNPHHRDAKSLEWWAENDQNAVGLSHMAQVRSKWTPEGVEEVTDIVKVESVDLVANPATTKGLMESELPSKDVTEEDFFDMIAKRMEARAVRKKSGEPAKVAEASETKWTAKILVSMAKYPAVGDWMVVSSKSGTAKDEADAKLSGQTWVGSNILSAKRNIGTSKAFGTKDFPEKLVFKSVVTGPTGDVLDQKTYAPVAYKKESKMAKKTTNNYATWKSWVKAAGAVRIDGDKDIATALDKDGNGVGEWDGETGDLYEKSSAKESSLSSLRGNPKYRSATTGNKLAWKEWAREEGYRIQGNQAYNKAGVLMGEWNYDEGILYFPKSGTSESSGVKESEMSSEDLAAILANTELDDAGKIAAIQELIAGEAGGDEEEAPALPLGEAEDEEDKKDEEEEKPATESLKPQKMDPTIRRLMEEVETYRLRDKREKLVKEAREACKVLPTYAVTESFVGVLADSEKKNWKTLIEDRRKVIYRGEAPVSAAAPGGNLTVDALVKALRS